MNFSLSLYCSTTSLRRHVVEVQGEDLRRYKISLVGQSAGLQSRGRRFDSDKKSNIEKSNLHGFELHRLSSKGTKSLFHVIKATIKQTINPATPDSFRGEGTKWHVGNAFRVHMLLGPRLSKSWDRSDSPISVEKNKAAHDHDCNVTVIHAYIFGVCWMILPACRSSDLLLLSVYTGSRCRMICAAGM